MVSTECDFGIDIDMNHVFECDMGCYCCWLFWGIYVALAIFQPYRDLEAGDTVSLKS